MDIDIQDVFNILTFAYVHGMSFGLSNPNISKTPDPVIDYVLSKDFAFIFDYGDNDFSTCIFNAAFIGDYMKSSIDSCWIGGNKEFNAMSLLNEAQDLANNYFNFETDTHKTQTDSVRVNWKFGTWNEVSKFGLENTRLNKEMKNLKTLMAILPSIGLTERF